VLIDSFQALVAEARRAGPIRVAVAAAQDPEVLKAVDQAHREGMIEATLVGDWPAIEAYAEQTGVALAGMTLLHEPSSLQAAERVVSMAREGLVDAVVKGQVKTADLLGIALNRRVGIRGPGLLTHVALFDPPGLDRLLYLSDSGVVVYPDVYQKLQIIKNAVDVAHEFGIDTPKVAILAASAKVHPRVPASIDALALTKMAEQGWVEGALVDGPLGLESAISPQAAELENARSPIGGRADILIVPNVEAGNIAAKGLIYFAHARTAGLVVGGRVPIIISSRAESAETRFLSIAMATVLARRS
jgi:phosphate butyryltransferase